MAAAKKKCVDCDGAGMVPGRYTMGSVKCETCGGSGTVKETTGAEND